MPNILKFGELIEYNMRNIFLEKSYTKCRGEASPRSFYGKSELSISLDQHWNVFFLFLFYVYQNLLKLRCLTVTFTLYKV